MPLDDKALRYWNVKTNQWQVEGGSYTISVGVASDDIRLQAAVQLAGDSVPLPYDTLSSYRGVLYDDAPPVPEAGSAWALLHGTHWQKIALCHCVTA